MNKKQWKFFEWGDENPGYVSTWYADHDGRVIFGNHIRKETARARGYAFECPFSRGADLITDLDKLNILTLINLALDHLAAEGGSTRYRLQEAARLLEIARGAALKIADNIQNNISTEEN